MKKNRFLKFVSVVVSAAMVINCCGSGLASASKTLLSIVQGNGNEQPPFTERPGSVWHGRHPGRLAETRGGFYPERTHEFIERAAQRWRGHGGEGWFKQAYASIFPGLVTGGMSTGGGGGIPGEGRTGGASTGGGIINTANGNLMKPYTLLTWPSVGELEFALTLYYNSVSDYAVELGNDWSFNFGAKLSFDPSTPTLEDAVIRWGDGTVIVFQETSTDVFEAPDGCFDTFTKLGNGNYQVKTPDQFEFEFTIPNQSLTQDLGDLVAIRDRNGNQITITISTKTVGSNTVERVTKVQDAISGRYIDLDYNSDGYIDSIVDHEGREWAINYYFSSLEEIVYPELDSITYSRTFELLGSDVLRETDLRGNEWDYDLDVNGKLESITNPLEKTTTYTYGDTATTITHPGGKTTVHNYSDGLLASEVDESGFSVDYITYNSDRLAEEITDKREKTWLFDYDSSGNLLTATNPLSHTITYTYESNNDLNTVTNHEGEVWNYDYYTTGAKNLWKVYDPEGRRLALYDYNAYGDIDSIKDADDEETTVAYGSDGYPISVTDPYSKISKLHFDALGRVDYVEDPIQALTLTAADRTDILYDVWDRQTKVTHPPATTGGTRYFTQFTYDEEDNLTSVIDERDETVGYTYDAAGQLTHITNQENEVEVLGYNDRGWVNQVTNGRGKTRNYYYTDRGDIWAMQLPGNTGEAWSYDGNGNVTVHSYRTYGFSPQYETKYYTYDNANRLTLVDYATLAMTNVSFDYDDADRMIEMIDGTGTTEWFYDLDGQVNKMISPQGTMEYDYYSTTGKLWKLIEKIPGSSDIVTEYAYDDAGRTETVSKFGETTTFTYDSASRPIRMTYATGAYAKYTYDGRSRITAVEHFNSSNSLLRKETNTYDEASRITSRYEGPTSGGVTTTFGYDDIGQLTSESATGYSASYSYDANGNRESRTINGITETYTNADDDRLTSVTWSQGGNNYEKAYAYHFSGRVTGITYKTNGATTSSETLGWNKENRLTSRGANTYTYNGLNTRVAKTDGGGSFTYKRAGAGQTDPVLSDGAANYLPGISEKKSGTSTFFYSGIKSDNLQTNSSQTNTATNRYDAYGNLLATTGTWKGPFAYGGKFGYQTDTADIQLLGDRYYDSAIGRFLNRDTAKDGRNWYGYCENDPLHHFDSTGRKRSLLRILWDLAWQAPQNQLGLIGSIGGKYSLDPVSGGIVVEGAWLTKLKVIGVPMTLGEYILSPGKLSVAELDHERVHLSQSRSLGPIYLIAQAGGYNVGAWRSIAWKGKLKRAYIHDASPMEMDADARSGNIDNIERNEFVNRFWLGRY